MYEPTTLAPGIKKLLTTAEAAELLGLKNKETLAVWRCTKRYPELEYIKIGRVVRYRREVIDAFIKLRTVTGPNSETEFVRTIGNTRSLNF